MTLGSLSASMRRGWWSRIGGLVVLLGSAATAAQADPPTYGRDVAPILRRHCLGCHRRGQVGPFALETYEQARKRAQDIVAVIEERLMPPWKPDPEVGPALKHDPSLAPEEIATLIAWADAGAPPGDLGLVATPPAESDGWSLGTPDLVLEPAEEFVVPAAGPDIYRCFVIPTNFAQVVDVAAIEYQPGNRRVVHHLSTYLDTSHVGRMRDQSDPGPGYTSFSGPGVPVASQLGFWTAGNRAVPLPEGVGYRFPAGGDVILQVHYHPTGKPEADRTRIGLYFARRPVKQTLHWNDASNFDFRLPAGRPAIEIKGRWIVPTDVVALAVSPHMHQLGRSMSMSVNYPDGRQEDLIAIPDWDPDWQNAYYFEKPIRLPKGSIVRVNAVFDNTDHPRNPHSPPRTVTSGYGLGDEMCVGYIAVVKDGQDLTQAGEEDDLHEIFTKQRAAILRRYLSQRRR